MLEKKMSDVTFLKSNNIGLPQLGRIFNWTALLILKPMLFYFWQKTQKLLDDITCLRLPSLVFCFERESIMFTDIDWTFLGHKNGMSEFFI